MSDTSSVKKPKEKKDFSGVIMAVVILVIIFLAMGMPEKIKHEIMFDKGIEAMRSSDYDEAIEYFDTLRKEDADDAYELKCYANYLRYKDTDFGMSKYYIDQIASYYKGRISVEIVAEKKAFNKKYEDHMNKLRAEAAKDKYKYDDVLPFVGMSQLYIEHTYLGKPYKVEKSIRRFDDVWYNEYEYTWCTRVGEYMLMTATCVDYVTECVVTDVQQYNLQQLWENGMPDLSGNSYKGSSSKKNNNYSYNYNYGYDDYDVYDYSDFEDFYYDNEADFDDLDDAEDYYEDAWDGYDW